MNQIEQDATQGGMPEQRKSPKQDRYSFHGIASQIRERQSNEMTTELTPNPEIR